MSANRILKVTSHFNCPKCGPAKVRGEFFYSILQYFTAVLECRCDKSNDGICARKTFFIRTDYEKIVFFDSERSSYHEKQPKEVEAATELEKFEIHCEKCFRHSHKNDWVIESDEPVVDEESVEYYFYCLGCGSEIEFSNSCLDHEDSLGAGRSLFDLKGMNILRGRDIRNDPGSRVWNISGNGFTLEGH